MTITTPTPAEIVARLRAGMKTQNEIADALGVSQPTVSAWIAGRQEMSRPVRILAEKIIAERAGKPRPR